MTAVDTSVVVAGLLVDHAQHDQARAALIAGPAVPAHVALESYSVLTRLPAPGRVPPGVAARLLARTFEGRFISLASGEHESLIAEFARLGIVGGAAYDAVVAATARKHGLTLQSLDRRASPTYDAMGVPYELI